MAVILMVVLSGCMEALPTRHTHGLLPTALADPWPPRTEVGSSTDTPEPTLEPSLVERRLTPTTTAADMLQPAKPLVLAYERTNEQRWRDQQQERVVFDTPKPYYTTGTKLYWYDPLTQQHLELGYMSGEFLVQARFVLLPQGVPALEVPYQINVSYGLTALSPALLERIRAAGYTAWIETYVIESPEVQPR